MVLDEGKVYGDITAVSITVGPQVILARFMLCPFNRAIMVYFEVYYRRLLSFNLLTGRPPTLKCHIRDQRGVHALKKMCTCYRCRKAGGNKCNSRCISG